MKTTSRPLYVKVHAEDNVAIIVNQGGLPRGTRFDSGLVLLEDVPEAHKVALTDIAEGGPILRYGVVIAYADVPIARGNWVHEGVTRLPEPPSLENLPIATTVPEPQAPLHGYTFEGFLNKDGSVGTKNILGITTTVQCVAATVEFAVKRIKAELLPQYPNVDDVIAITHSIRMRHCDRRSRLGDSNPHAAQPQLESESGRSASRCQPGMRKAAAGAVDAVRHAARPFRGFLRRAFAG